MTRTALPEISHIFPISDDWLPAGGGAWLIIDGDPTKDNPENMYPNTAFRYSGWSHQDQTYWKKASMELYMALRHPPRDLPQLMIHENGWADTLDCIRHLRAKVTKYSGISYEYIDKICSYNWLFGVTICDNKHRFQLAGATDTYGILKDGSKVISFGFIRAKSGHSGSVARLVNDKSAYSQIPIDFAGSTSCLCHKTRRQHIRDIFYNGLMPGEMIRTGGRRHVNLSPFLPHDPRNTAVGRGQITYDTVIIFKKDRVFREHEMLLSANGIVATIEVLSSDLTQLVYVVPSGQYAKRWVLYDPSLCELVSLGCTAVDMSHSYPRDMSWEHARRVAKDSYACPNPTCGLFNPKGFTACATGGCKFTFEAVIGPSTVELPRAGSALGNSDITAQEYHAYGLRVAKFAVRAQESRTFVYTDNYLLWTQVCRCLDWRRKWYIVWTREDNLTKLRKGGSRWHSGAQWEQPSHMAFKHMSQVYPVGTPGAHEFYVRHRGCLVDTSHTDHAFLSTVYTVGVICDRLEEAFFNLVQWLPRWHKAEANNLVTDKVYRETLSECLVACNETLKSMVVPFRVRATAVGDEKRSDMPSGLIRLLQLASL